MAGEVGRLRQGTQGEARIGLLAGEVIVLKELAVVGVIQEVGQNGRTLRSRFCDTLTPYGISRTSLHGIHRPPPAFPKNNIALAPRVFPIGARRTQKCTLRNALAAAAATGTALAVYTKVYESGPGTLGPDSLSGIH